jgi:hypothetical protein
MSGYWRDLWSTPWPLRLLLIGGWLVIIAMILTVLKEGLT